ncbi:hypothetical protein [Vibrio breoganii]|uniref:hypothetical protein n=1 Tax=Vibrio breoganii TaxID=553239 RepID=UPI000311FAA4|nr:hypothetical protein [Vibrio breoganii]OEF81499.1 hypothetical protein B003_02540 [Vibrio breoganii 1C10]PMK16125.1 hypothetical protein BCU06_12850 [Vibrio breoganii]PML53354.1 hypothetical protein BCT73_17285 [Vibrio breoganii]PMM81649.1 hypothetical protein BCT45_13695 [Vibrio breoganii]PMO86128.1 hypothetical protein BCT00_00505 [Vibrio breoganii]
MRLNTQVLWEQGTILSDSFQTTEAKHPQPDPQWIELTVASPNKTELTLAIKQCLALYLDLREHEDIQENTEAQEMCIRYLESETHQ